MDDDVSFVTYVTYVTYVPQEVDDNFSDVSDVELSSRGPLHPCPLHPLYPSMQPGEPTGYPDCGVRAGYPGLPIAYPAGHAAPGHVADAIAMPRPHQPTVAAASQSAGRPSISADGEILSVGSRVQTQFSRARGGDDSWYAGAILALHDNRTATVIYDDGEEWVGRLDEIYVLQGEQDDDDGTAQPPPLAAPALMPATAAPATTQPVVPVVGVPVQDRSR